MRLALPDLISNSYFPSISAVELGDFADQGLEMTHELIFPVDKCYQALRDIEWLDGHHFPVPFEMHAHRNFQRI